MQLLNDNFLLKNCGYSNYGDAIKLPRHRWYYYKEGFSPLLVEMAIDEVGLNKSDIIIDPFNGSGTTTLTASVLGYQSLGIEVNPFTTFLSQAKVKAVDINAIDKGYLSVLRGGYEGKPSPLSGFSTFSEREGINKWLFNSSVLDSFEGAWQAASSIKSNNLRMILKFASIAAAMKNCNATRDGKCLRYRKNWRERGCNKDSFLTSFTDIVNIIKDDIEDLPLKAVPTIVNADARQFLRLNSMNQSFKLCITSPPYLNTFDYTDIYRPELFLGKFVYTQDQLYNLRLNTVRSHIQAKWEKPLQADYGALYSQSINHVIQNSTQLMHKSIPLMIQAYFEDMCNVLTLLFHKAKSGAQLWLVVSNSAYANTEIPVDLIIGDIGSKIGWRLKEIGVLRYIQRRKTRHSPNIIQLRESVIILTKA